MELLEKIPIELLEDFLTKLLVFPIKFREDFLLKPLEKLPREFLTEFVVKLQEKFHAKHVG